MLRDYDEAMVFQFGVTAVTPAGQELHYVTPVPGITAPVPVLSGLTEQWFLGRTLPAINVRRLDMVPNLTRRLPGFKAVEFSTNPATPNTWNVQASSSEPMDFLYQVELATTSQRDLNALLEYVLTKFPPSGYQSALTLYGRQIPFRQTGFHDLTLVTDNKDGRLLRVVFTYTVEGWFVSLACEKVPTVLRSTLGVVLNTEFAAGQSGGTSQAFAGAR